MTMDNNVQYSKKLIRILGKYSTFTMPIKLIKIPIKQCILYKLEKVNILEPFERLKN